MLAIRLPASLEQRLADLARKTGRTKTFSAREAIEMHLADLEDAFLAADRLNNPAKRWTQEELESDIDLDS